MIKKTATLILAFAMMIMPAGCGQRASEEAAPGQAAGGKYSAENPYHLVFAFPEFYTQDDAARSAVEKAINDKMIPEYSIEVEFLPLQFSEWENKVQLMFTGSDELDVIPIYFERAASWISMDALIDMNAYMDTEDGAQINSALGDWAAVGTMNGVLYGFPAKKESTQVGGLCLNADICDELGITEKYGFKSYDDAYKGSSHTWAEVEDILAAVQKAYPDIAPLYVNNADASLKTFVQFDNLIDSFGVLDWNADHDTTTVVNRFETGNYKNTVTMLADWYDKGYIYKDSAIDTQGDFALMKAGSIFSFACMLKPGYLAEKEATVGRRMYAMYVYDSEHTQNTSTDVNFYNTGIAANSKDPEMAFKFIRALYTDAELMNLWQFGVEGVNYQVLEDGTAFFVDGEDSSNYTYFQNSGWMMGNQYIGYVWNDGTKDATYWAKLEEHDGWADSSAAFGFMWDSTEYATQISALNNVKNTYRAALQTGSIGSAKVESTLEEFNNALYAAGLQDVIDEKQRQLDDWLSKQ
ncbi:MAG: ABC transporter substrate-binding protein [Clostridiales bacterium]|jgi:putative aldouronate transport system substrate-binding protein|nr:ABC transporter substrate-binding protein [Clostridiales bacterium]